MVKKVEDAPKQKASTPKIEPKKEITPDQKVTSVVQKKVEDAKKK